MKDRMNIDRFRELKAQAADVLALRQQTKAVLARRPIRSFDGFGHFLDAVLGDDVQCMESLAQTVRLPVSTLDQLRASELDPVSAHFDEVAYLGFLLGIDRDDFSRLVTIDHSRFSRHADTVLARSGDDSDDNPTIRITRMWARFDADSGTGL